MMLVTRRGQAGADAAICPDGDRVDVVRGRSIKILGMGSVIGFVAIGGYLPLATLT